MNDRQKRIDEIAEIMWENLYTLAATGHEALQQAMEIGMKTWDDGDHDRKWLELSDGEEADIAEFCQAIGHLAQRIKDEGLMYIPAMDAGRVNAFNR
jgi:hypothetical protein